MKTESLCKIYSLSDVCLTTQSSKAKRGATPDWNRQVCTNIFQVKRWYRNPEPSLTTSMRYIQPSDKSAQIYKPSGKEKGVLFMQSLLNTNPAVPTLCLALFHALGNSREHSPWPWGTYILVGRGKQMYRMPDATAVVKKQNKTKQKHRARKTLLHGENSWFFI